jgi:hypothetical protein
MVSNNYWFLSINCCMSVCPLAFGSLMWCRYLALEFWYHLPQA